MGKARTLKQKERDKIQRLLETSKVDNVRLAIELTENTCSETDVDAIYTDEIIVSLLSNGDVELFATIASFFLGHKTHWQRFLDCATNTKVLTRTAMLSRTAELSEFTSITVEAAILDPREMIRSGFDVALDGLRTLSIEVARELVKHRTNLSLTGLVTITDDVATVLSTHLGDGLHLNGLTSLTDAAVDSLKDFKGYDGYFCGLELGGLTDLSDVAARSFGKHRGRLDLSGLTVLSDAAAKGLSKHKGTMDLSGLTTLSVVAAKQLAKHDGGIDLYGLNDLSDEAAVEFANKKSVRTSEEVHAQIKKALKTLTATSASLSPSQRKKIKKLINEKHLSTAFELLKAADAEEGDWLAVFPKTKIKTLIDTWDVTTWNTLVKEFKPMPKVYELLKAALYKRTNYRGSDSNVYIRYSNNLGPILSEASKELKSLIKKLLKDNPYLP